MARGKTNQPLRIAVPSGWGDRSEIEALREQGHTVVYLQMDSVDLILAPQASRWCDEMAEEVERKDGTKHRPYLDAAIKGARARKRETK